MSLWQQVALGVLGLLGGGGGLVALYRAITDRPRIQAEAAQIITTSATGQMTQMEGRLDRVEKKYEAVVLLLDKTRDQLQRTDDKAATAERQAERLLTYQRDAAEWHRRHIPFDQVMTEIVSQLRPEMLEDPDVLDRIPEVEPFPLPSDL